MDFTRAIESPTNPDFPPSADRLYGRSISFGPPPDFYYELRKVTVAATAGHGEPGDKDYEAPTAEQSLMLVNGNVSMTQAQWDAWTIQNAAAYVPPCLAENLALTLADE